MFAIQASQPVQLVGVSSGVDEDIPPMTHFFNVKGAQAEYDGDMVDSQPVYSMAISNLRDSQQTLLACAASTDNGSVYLCRIQPGRQGHCSPPLPSNSSLFAT